MKKLKIKKLHKDYLEVTMKKKLKKLGLLALVFVVFMSSLVIVQHQKQFLQVEAATVNTWNGDMPKYVFMFIGDGLSYAQIVAATDYLGVEKYENKVVSDVDLAFTQFEVAGTATTFDSTSFCPDSASTATSISTGNKTHSGVVNMDMTKTKVYETISEKLKKQKGYKIGIISSVPINHATPAAFYAHQASRNNYYDIGIELINSNFDYFAGGGLLQVEGKEGEQRNLVELAKQKGFEVPETTEEILSLHSQDAPVLAIIPDVDAGMALPYEIDREEGALSLADFTRKGIDVLDNDKGFFMMVEGGKIDWACHANDAMAAIGDVLAFNEAVEEAVKFYYQHPNDTLIIVTGDHETGGLTMGYAATGYSTYLDILGNQTMSYAMFDEKIAGYREENVPFETVVKDIETNFGLITSEHPEAEENPSRVLSEYELQKLQDAYTMSMITKEDRTYSDADKLLYGGYEPLSVTITHVMNNKAGIGWTSYSHTGVPVGVFAKGVGEELFNGYYDNTDIFSKLSALTGTR
jgi:alkaline phosphatase